MIYFLTFILLFKLQICKYNCEMTSKLSNLVVKLNYHIALHDAIYYTLHRLARSTVAYLYLHI